MGAGLRRVWGLPGAHEERQEFRCGGRTPEDHVASGWEVGVCGEVTMISGFAGTSFLDPVAGSRRSSCFIFGPLGPELWLYLPCESGLKSDPTSVLSSGLSWAPWSGCHGQRGPPDPLLLCLSLPLFSFLSLSLLCVSLSSLPWGQISQAGSRWTDRRAFVGWTGFHQGLAWVPTAPPASSLLCTQAASLLDQVPGIHCSVHLGSRVSSGAPSSS